jgi:hypothetical protein
MIFIAMVGNKAKSAQPKKHRRQSLEEVGIASKTPRWSYAGLSNNL